jgi:hypothetical protein
MIKCSCYVSTSVLVGVALGNCAVFFCGYYRSLAQLFSSESQNINSKLKFMEAYFVSVN